MATLTRADERMFSIIRMVMRANRTYSLDAIITRLAGIEDDGWTVTVAVARMHAEGYLRATRLGYRLTPKALEELR